MTDELASARWPDLTVAEVQALREVANSVDRLKHLRVEDDGSVDWPVPCTGSGLPRRIQLEHLTPAEVAIQQAMIAVEGAGTHQRLTDAVLLLQQAQTAVADYVDFHLGGGHA